MRPRTRRASLAQAMSKARCDRCGRTVRLREIDGTWHWAARTGSRPDPLTCPLTGTPHLVVGRPFWMA